MDNKILNKFLRASSIQSLSTYGANYELNKQNVNPKNFLEL